MPYSMRTEARPRRVGFRSLPWPGRVEVIVFTDFDETYLAHAGTAEQRRWLADLERFLLHRVDRGRMLFGWVTGSSASSVLSRLSAGGARVLPHFIASSLGTDLRFIDADGQARSDDEWVRRMRASRYCPPAVSDLLHALSDAGVALTPQSHGSGSEFMASYYYRSRDPEADAAAARTIRALAAERGIGANVSRCNPYAGDPADCYDIDFTPSVCGKRNIVRYLRSRFGVPPPNTFAFGDSGGDIEMLEEVGHGVLVANCTDEARQRYPRVSEFAHARAILATLAEHTQA